MKSQPQPDNITTARSNTMQPVRIRLPHSGLQVPHTDYRVTSLKQHNTHDGVAYVATLRKGKQIIGNIENGGTGGPDMFYPSTAEGYRTEINAIEAFASHCLSERGDVPDLEFVLSDLVTEYDIDREIKRAAKKRMVLVRLREDYIMDDEKPMGWPSTTATTHAPAEWDRERLTRELGKDDLAPHELAWWQVWNPTTNEWEDATPRPAHLTDANA